MNKYKENVRADNRDSIFCSLECGELEAARMHKPGYRRKMRHTNNKHSKNAKNTSH